MAEMGNQTIDDRFRGMIVGVVKGFNDQKGYGFINFVKLMDGEILYIENDRDDPDILVHHSHIKNCDGSACRGFRTLHEKQIVYFDFIDTPKGLQVTEVIPTKRDYFFDPRP